MRVKRWEWAQRPVVVWMCLVLLAALPPAALAQAVPPQQTTTAPLVDLRLEPFLSGLVEPLFITNAGDGSNRLFIVERTGRVRVARDGVLQAEPFLDISERIISAGQHQGLLGLAFHPQFATNGLFFVSYTALDGANTVERYRVAEGQADTADPASGVVILAVPDRASDHNIGMLAFGPDSYLYVGTGDEGGYGDPFGNAQNLTSLYGKLLRLDVDAEGVPYAIPPDNPFAERDDARGEIWALGLRSPWRFSFDRATGDLWLGDVGEARWEEINYQQAGSPGGVNFGWNLMEGATCFPIGSDCDPQAFTPPLEVYGHTEGCSVTGGYVYRGSASPALAGGYIFGDFCTGRIWMLHNDDGSGWQRTELLDTGHYISSFGEDEAGELYLTDLDGGTVLKLTAEEQYPQPRITALDPDYALPGSGPLTLTIYGSGLTAATTVLWDGVPQPTTLFGTTRVTIDISVDQLVDARAVTLQVVNPTPGGGASNTATFIISTEDPSAASFRAVWARTDQPVADMVAARTWMWGPAFGEPLQEMALESPNGMRTVQYYDKARMEISAPGVDMQADWYVTSGLLAKELITGQMQIGISDFVNRGPAQVNIAGDPDDPHAPTYATFAPLLAVPAHAAGAVLTQTLDRSGVVGDDPSLATYGVLAFEYVAPTGHTIASVFWEFMQSSGAIYRDGAVTEGPLFANLFYAVGYPISEAYWTTVSVGGVPRLVLVQAFERRVLTYTPDNPPGWQVEAGNVGQHYYRWRYGE